MARKSQARVKPQECLGGNTYILVLNTALRYARARICDEYIKRGVSQSVSQSALRQNCRSEKDDDSGAGSGGSKTFALCKVGHYT